MDKETEYVLIADTTWNNGNYVRIQLVDDDIETLIEQIKGTIRGLGYSENTIQKYIPDK